MLSQAADDACTKCLHSHVHVYIQETGLRGLYPAEWDHDISFWVPDGFEDAAFETLARCECACVYVSVSVCECVCACACVCVCVCDQGQVSRESLFTF